MQKIAIPVLQAVISQPEPGRERRGEESDHQLPSIHQQERRRTCKPPCLHRARTCNRTASIALRANSGTHGPQRSSPHPHYSPSAYYFHSPTSARPSVTPVRRFRLRTRRTNLAR